MQYTGAHDNNLALRTTTSPGMTTTHDRGPENKLIVTHSSDYLRSLHIKGSLVGMEPQGQDADEGIHSS